MPNAWSLLDEKRLLFNIIEISGVKMPSWIAVSEKMDGAYTAEACRQHFQKMKRESIKGDGSAKRKSKPGTPKTPSRKRKQLNGDAEDDELTSTPSKIKKMKEEEEGVEPAVVHKIKDDDVKDDKLEEYSSDNIYD